MPNVHFNYNKDINGFKDSRIRGLGTEVSALIEEGLKDNNAKKSVIPYLYNEVKSNKQTERISIEEGYDLMDPTPDGDVAKTDKSQEIGHKDISHVIYTKNVMVTETMMEDSYYNMSPDIELKARSLPDSYWRTREAVAQNAYINGHLSSFNFRGATIDTTTYDGMPLFSNAHKYGDESGHATGTQSNNYFIRLGEDYTAGDVAEVLSAGAAVINQMLNSNGEAQDFDADTVLIPRGVATNGFVDKVRRAIGSEYFPSTATSHDVNTINTQSGQWNFVPMGLWKPAKPEIIIMSQDAKKMMKSMFYNRIDLKVNVWETPGTGTLNWRSRTRFGVGHVDYKHCMKITILGSSDNTDGMTELKI